MSREKIILPRCIWQNELCRTSHNLHSKWCSCRVSHGLIQIFI